MPKKFKFQGRREQLIVSVVYEMCGQVNFLFWKTLVNEFCCVLRNRLGKFEGLNFDFI